LKQRYRLDLSYDGSRYHGWQKQPNATTIQEKIENALSIVFQVPIEVVGSGRTDAGVHAEQQVAHFDLVDQHDVNSKKVLHSLRGLLPRDIMVYELELVSPDFHARFDAIQRYYRYQLSRKPNVFTDRYTWLVPDFYDVEAATKTVSIFLGEHDFSAFCKHNSDINNNRCKVSACELVQVNVDSWNVNISANRFLHHMVRSIVSAIVDVGRGKMNPLEVAKRLEELDRTSFSVKAPAHALFLEKVVY
jgi:tRNA pseudouridine38-40 synthase